MNTLTQTPIRTISSLFDYRQVLRQLQEKGKQMFGQHFRFYTEDLPVLVPIIAWMLRDEDVAAQFGIDLKKGIFLSGPTGVGKTQIMQLMRCVVAPTADYTLESCRKIALEFGRTGTHVLHRYTYGSFTSSHTSIAYCFDDLGKEIDTRFYGTTCKVMQQIFLGRYELFIQHGMITHATSSLTTKAIEARYGTEVRSRCREMFNRIVFHKDAKDKRKTN